MAINPNEDTEFNDALRKHGILPPRPPTPPSPSPPPSPTFEDVLNDFTPSELRELAEDAQDDEAERMISAFRQQKLNEQKQLDKKARFGGVYPISRDDYTREVTEASEVDEEDDTEGKGTPVICFLYKMGLPHCERAHGYLHILAARYPRTKFVSIIGDQCIPNLPDSRLPMFIIYRNGEVVDQAIAWNSTHLGTLEELQTLLAKSGAINLTERGRYRPRQNRGDDDESDEDYLDASSRMKSASTTINTRSQKNIRGSAKKGGDSDSDFEFDI